MNLKPNISKSLRDSINQLYAEFSLYPLPHAGIVTCLDYGPTELETIELSKPLKEIKREYIKRLEFFGEEWGTMAEVKYLIPRILECYVEDVEDQDYCTGFHFIRYKLADLDQKEGSKWNKNEVDCIREYFLLFYRYLSILPDRKAIDAYLDLMDTLCEVVEDISPFILIWQKVQDSIKSKQIEEWLNEHINPNTLELISEKLLINTPHELRAKKNKIKIMAWVLSEENIVNNIELFTKDPWFKLSLK